MKTRSLTLLVVLFICCNAFSQKDVSRWLSDFEINGKQLKILRIPKEEVGKLFKINIANDVTWFQRELDTCKNRYLQNRVLRGNERNSTQMYIEFIQNQDPDFPLNYFQDELLAYANWNDAMNQQLDDARTERMRRREDSLQAEQMKEGYFWINPDFVWVKPKPDAKTASMGKLFRLSYVHAYEVDNKPDWVELGFGEHSGYILKKDLAETWEDMSLTGEETAKLKTGRYYNFEPTPLYAAAVKKAAENDERAYRTTNAAPKKNYIRGPRGGCYYINASGNKQYVDRSLCN